MKTLIIETNYGSLELAISGKCGTAVSHFTEPLTDKEHRAALQGLESLVLSHACAGLDVTSPKYLEGLNTALATIDTELGE